MQSTFFGLNIGKTGLYAYKAALDTTAHNIANTETEGYSRQVMGQKAGKALRMNNTYGMAGTGVDVTGVVQLRDEYYDIKYWKNNLMLGEYACKSHYMNEIQNYFNEVSVEGFTKTFNSMYESLSELQKNPSSETVRTQVINFSKSLTEYFNSMSQNMKSIQKECNFEIRNKVDQINSTAQQIAALTKQINTLEISGAAANDLRDQRTLLVDELSEIANISVTEKTIGQGVGVTSYVIKINNQTLVDTGNYNSLHVIPRDKPVNQNDAEGLYDVAWSNGQIFDLGSSTLGGTLQALYEIRDGNNNKSFTGHVDAAAGASQVIVTNTNVNNEADLNIPQEGIIAIGNREYEYSGFSVERNGGNFVYTFRLNGTVAVSEADAEAKIGKSIGYKGIPHYMEQMNKFIRTYSREFNAIHRTGKDMEGNPGADFFTATDKVSGREYVWEPLVSSPDYAAYDFNTFTSRTGPYYTAIPDNQPVYASYYLMTAENFTVNSSLLSIPSLLAAAKDVEIGVENNDIIDELIALKTDKGMFDQGEPGAFMQTLVADIGIDASKADNFSESQENIIMAITNQRLSISGVDMDEEAMNLVRFQNAYNLSAKVISVMDEVYERLITYMGV